MVGYACHLPGCQTYPSGIAITPLLEAAGVEFPDRGEFLTVVGEIQNLSLLKVFQRVGQSIKISTSNSVQFPPLVAVPIPLKVCSHRMFYAVIMLPFGIKVFRRF